MIIRIIRILMRDDRSEAFSHGLRSLAQEEVTLDQSGQLSVEGISFPAEGMVVEPGLWHSGSESEGLCGTPWFNIEFAG